MVDHVQFDVTWEFKNGSTWVDFSSDVYIRAVDISRGIKGNSIESRMAAPGRATFTVRNDAGCSGGVEGYYTPLHTNCRAGWGKDTEVRVTFTADGIGYEKFRGEITTLTPIGDLDGGDISVIVEGRLKTTRKKMTLPALARNKTLEEGVELVLDNYSLEFDGGIEVEGTLSETFLTIFDVTQKEASGLSELTQLVKSEFGFMMMIGGRKSGETLRIQARGARSSASVPNIPAGNDYSPLLVDYDGNQLVDYDGNWLVGMDEQTVDIHHKGILPSSGVIINRAVVKVTPRRENETVQVLFKLDSQPELEPGESMEIEGAYSDPDAEAMEVAAYSMQTPVSGTDYTAENESEVDRTAYLDVSAPEYGVKTVKNVFENTHPSENITVTLLQNKGYGVYFFRPVDVPYADISGETYEKTFDLVYLSDLSQAYALAQDIVDAMKDERLEADGLDFELEHSWDNYWAGVFLEPGDKIPVVDARYDIDTYAFIQNYALKCSQGAWSCSYGLSSLAVSTI